MQRHATHILANLRFAHQEMTGSTGAAGKVEFEPNEGAKDSSELTHLSRGVEERPDRPPFDHVFVLFKVNVRGMSVDEVVQNKGSFKAALASSLPEGDGVTGNDIAVELVALVEDVAGQTGNTRDVEDVPAENEDEAGGEVEEDGKDEEGEGKQGSEEASSFLQLRTEPLPPNVRIRFRLVVADRKAKSVVADLRTSVEGEASPFQEALGSEGFQVSIEAVEEPELITHLDEAQDEQEDGDAEDGDAKGGSAGQSLLARAEHTSGARSLLSAELSVLPSFSLILALVVGVFLL